MELTPKLPLHKIVPLFTLPEKHGEPLNLAKQRGRNHLALLIFGPDIQPRAYLQELAASAEAWKQLPARGLVVVPDEDSAGALGSLPFSVLIDGAGRVRNQFLPAGAVAGVFALDRYGDLYHQWLVSNAAALPSATEIDGWLQAISMQCSI